MADDEFARADETPGWLYGRWTLLHADPAIEFAPGVRMEFLPGGRLHYRIAFDGHEHVVDMIYRVIGDMLETDNPSAPHRASTRFEHGDADVLIFHFSGARAVFVRHRE